jgi:hypothetical protein
VKKSIDRINIENFMKQFFHFLKQIARNTFRSNRFTATGGDRTLTSAGAVRVQNFRQGALLEGNLFIANQGMQAGTVTVGGGDGSTVRITGNTFDRQGE